MKSLITILLILACPFFAQAQYDSIIHSAGTATYGGISVDVTSAGTASTYPGWCGAGPYWIGAGTGGGATGPYDPGSYTFTFVPSVNRLRMFFTAADAGESISVTINGTLHTITPAELTAWTSTCGTPVIPISGDTLLSTGPNSSAELNIFQCGITTLTIETDGVQNGSVFSLAVIDSGTCSGVSNNGPLCAGDTLKLAITDTGGSTFYWYGPAGFTSTISHPVIPNSTIADSGTYYVVETTGTITDTFSTVVIITPTPAITVSSSSPLCENTTLNLTSTDTVTTVAGTYSWTGPGGFTSALQNPVITGAPVSAGGEYVLTVTVGVCTATDSILVVVHALPVITVTETDPTPCVVTPDGSFTIHGLTAGTVYTVSYTSIAGMASSSTAADGSGNITIGSLAAGTYSNITVTNSFGCTSAAHTTTLSAPGALPAPLVRSNGPVCTDSMLLLFAADTSTGVTYHWTFPDGSTSADQNPAITDAAGRYGGAYTVYYTTPAGCNSNSATLLVTIKPTPATPVVTGGTVCTGSTLTLSVTSAAGATYTWAGPAGFMSFVANPSITSADTVNSGLYTAVATLNGCPSLPGTGVATVHPIPAAPLTADYTYCQYDSATVLTATGTALTWYTTPAGAAGISDPTPSTSTPGNVTYYVSQTVSGCTSPRAPSMVTVNIKPVVSIAPARAYVCQSDTLTLSFTGAALAGAAYVWRLPEGALMTAGNDSAEGPVTVRFDSAGTRAVTLTITASGCTTAATEPVTVVATPATDLFINADVCAGDTVTVALSHAGSDIATYTWDFDSAAIITATNVHDSHAGPYTVAWPGTGTHVISVTAYGGTGGTCPSETMYDTITVHALPGAAFGPATVPGCTGDTMTLRAAADIAGYSYVWGPARFFDGTNSAVTLATFAYASYVSLTVTDAYGCHATDSLLYAPGSCCTVTLPNAFTPHGSINTRFRPIGTGSHQLNIFRVVNRWGITVYESTTSTAAGWDGTYNQEPQDMGTYYWYIEYTCDGVAHADHGDVVLIR